MEPQQHHGCIFSDGFQAQISIGRGGNRIERLPGFQLNVEHALQGRSQNGGRDSLARNIHQRHVQRVFAGDDIEKVAADRAARDAVRLHSGKGKIRNLHRHQSLLNACRNLQLFLMLARLVLDGRQLRIVHQRRGLPRDRPHQIMIDVGEAAGLKAAFEIQRPEYLAAGGIFGALAMARLPCSPQRNADDGVNAACDDALRNLTLRAQRIGHDELVRASGRLAQHCARHGGSVGQHFACRIPAKSHFQSAIGARQKDVSALHLG